MTVLKRLAQHLKHRTVELGQLVAEKHAIMCKTDFTWLRIIASTDEGNLRDSVVRCTEWALADEASATTKLACNAVNLGSF